MSCQIIDRSFPSALDEAFLKEKEREWKTLRKIRHAMAGHIYNYCPNPFCVDSRMRLKAFAIEWEKKFRDYRLA